MSNKVRRIILIVFMLVIFAYTLFNYINGGLNGSSTILLIAVMAWLLVSQIGALIREWNDN